MKKNENLNFEESLSKLEAIVKDLENGNVPLDEAINKFNEAMILAKNCDEKLKSAEESINKIVNDDGSIANFNGLENES